jgi:antitoxin YefM
MLFIFISLFYVTALASTRISTYICSRLSQNNMRTANFTDFRANLKGYMDAVIDDCDTVIINRGNDTGVVLISLEEYNSLKETEYIMSSPETMEAIRRGDEEIKNGKGLKVDLDDLWK